MGLAALALGALCFVLMSRGRGHRLLGLRRPSGSSWLWAAPGVVLGGILGGVWIGPSDGPGFSLARVSTLLLLPLVAEVVFRGIGQGVLARDFSVQHESGRWFLSVPVALSTLLYLLWTLPLWYPSPGAAAGLWPGSPMLAAAAGALVVGLSLGVARERAESLAASLGLHYLGAAATVAALWWVG